MNKQIIYEDWGLLEYGTAWKRQEAVMQQGLAVKATKFNDSASAVEDTISNYLFTCSHPNVYTLGKSGFMENLLVNDERMKALDVSFYKTNRGGDITYHGPGQLVAYPILDLEQFYTDLGRYMRSLEEVVIRTIAEYGIEGGRFPGATGVWIEPDVPGYARKICAMGVRCSRWITMHGLALNMNTQLDYFNYIVPCGITDKGVTSIEKELGHHVDEAEITRHFLKHFGEIFEAELLVRQPAADR